MGTIQMNVRIDEDLKAQGDAVFAQLGYSPTQVIRAVWGYAACKRNDPDAVDKMLDEANRAIDPAWDEERRRRMQAAEEGLHIFPAFMRSVLASQDERWEKASDEEVMDWLRKKREKEGYVPIWEQFESNSDLHAYLAVERAIEKGIIEREDDEGEVADGRNDLSIWYEIAERAKNG